MTYFCPCFLRIFEEILIKFKTGKESVRSHDGFEGSWRQLTLERVNQTAADGFLFPCTCSHYLYAQRFCTSCFYFYFYSFFFLFATREQLILFLVLTTSQPTTKPYFKMCFYRWLFTRRIAWNLNSAMFLKMFSCFKFYHKIEKKMEAQVSFLHLSGILCVWFEGHWRSLWSWLTISWSSH